MWDWIKNLGAAAVDAYKVHREAKLKLELARLEGELRAEQAWTEWRIKNIDSDSAWEQASIQNSGWKDEFVLLVLSIPLLLVFVPPLVPTVLQGFAVLESTPEWYRWMIVLVYLATYGIRVWRRQM